MILIFVFFVKFLVFFDQEELICCLFSDMLLFKDIFDYLLQVVNVFESYGFVFDVYSKNLVDQGEQQMFNFFLVFCFFYEGFSFKCFWIYLMGDCINFEYVEYCQKVMFWYGIGGLDVYFDMFEFVEVCQWIIKCKLVCDFLLVFNNCFYLDFVFEVICLFIIIYCFGLFWWVMSDIFVDLVCCYVIKEVICVNDVVYYI